MDNELDDEEKQAVRARLLQYKDKKSLKKRSDIFVDVIPKLRNGKCVGAPSVMIENAQLALEATQSPTVVVNYNYISSDIWYHVGRFIEPEDVKTFALICRETADLVNRQEFWRNLFNRYVKRYVSLLPEHLGKTIDEGIPKSLRYCVIKSLFRCYSPLAKRAPSATLDFVIGYNYLASWYIKHDCYWYICHRFSSVNQTTRRFVDKNDSNCGDANDTDNDADDNDNAEICDNWESLFTNDDNEDNRKISKLSNTTQTNSNNVFHNPYEGQCLLIILGTRFNPLPTELVYKAGESSTKISLANAREMLDSDMSSKTIELDFKDSIEKKLIWTFKYPKIVKYLVAPWWHPEFDHFMKSK